MLYDVTVGIETFYDEYETVSNQGTVSLSANNVHCN